MTQYQQYPLRKAQALAGVGGARLFDTLFLYQKRPTETSFEIPTIYESCGGMSAVEYPVCVEMEMVDGRLLWRTACEDSVLTDQGTEELLERVDSVLAGIVHFPDNPALTFSEQGTSVCDLPPFTTKTDYPSLTNGHVNESSSPLSSGEWSSAELIIRDILSKVSKVPASDITKEQTLFHLGLDSISAIKVVSLLRREDIQISVSEILKAATVEKIAATARAAAVDSHATEEDAEKLLDNYIKGMDIKHLMEEAGLKQQPEKVLPATAGQVYMLSTWKNSGFSLVYPTFSYVVEGYVDKERLCEAWQKIRKQTPILRTTFIDTSNQQIPYLQIIMKEDTNPIIWLSADSDHELKKRQRNEIKLPPVTLLVRQVDGETRLHLQIHHALYDGISLPILINRLQHLYNNLETLLPQKPKFSDFLAIGATPSAKSEQKPFWTEYLNCSSTLLPTKPTSLPKSTQRIELFTPRLLPSTNSIEHLARKQGLSIQSLFLAAFARIYSALLPEPQPDCVFGIYLANRSHPIEGLVHLAAPTVNLVPLRVRNPSRTDLWQNARAVQEDLHTIGSTQNAGVGLWEIERWTGVKINCFVNFLRLPDGGIEGRDVSGGHGEIVIRDVEPEWKDGRREVVTLEMNEVEEETVVQGNSVADVYLVCLDPCLVDTNFDTNASHSRPWTSKPAFGTDSLMLVSSVRRDWWGLRKVMGLLRICGECYLSWRIRVAD